MALTPFMAAVMNGAVVIIREFLLLLLRMLLVAGGMFLHSFPIAFVVSAERNFACFFVPICVSCFATMGICLRLLLNHIGSQGLNSSALQ